LILSNDEQLLVVARGGHLTDAVLIESKQPLAQFVPWTEEDREQQWQRRTDTIRRLLAAHAGPPAPAIGLTEPEARARLDAWCRQISPVLERSIAGEDWQVSCAIEDMEPAERGRRQVWFTVTCRKGDSRHDIVRRMSVVEDEGRLLIVEQDTGLSWSSSDEKNLCEDVRSALLEHARSGTYLDGR
jgi:hypothetical protein